VDGEGKKMSKSTGNVIAPEEVINKLGADVLRLWVAAEDYRDDVKISDEILKRLADATFGSEILTAFFSATSLTSTRRKIALPIESSMNWTGGPSIDSRSSSPGPGRGMSGLNFISFTMVFRTSVPLR
jgi:hypothetical protein